MSPSRKVIAVTVNWNRGNDTVDCVRSVMNDDPGTEVIVVDNGSKDGSVALLRQQFPGLEVLENGENLGYVLGVNRGISTALEKGATHILLINNDAVSRPGMVTGLLEGLDRHPDAGIVGPTIYYYGKGDLVWFKGGHFNRYLGYSTHPHMDQPDDGDHADRKMEFITGCVMMVKAEVFRGIGLFDTDYQIYSEDLDFCLRANDSGWASWVIPKVAAEHKVSISTGVAGSNTMTPYRSYYCGRNMMILLGKRMTGLRLLSCLMGQMLVRMPYFMAMIMIDGEKGSLKQYLKGYLNALRYYIVR